MEDEDSAVSQHQSRFRQFLKTELKMKLPASDGVFEHPLAVKKIYEIGGLTDDNEPYWRSERGTVVPTRRRWIAFFDS